MTLPYDPEPVPVVHRLRLRYTRTGALKAARKILFRDPRVVSVHAHRRPNGCSFELRIAPGFWNMFSFRRFWFSPTQTWRASVQQVIMLRDRLPV